MKIFFRLLGFLSIIPILVAQGGWLYYQEYPWVWDSRSEDWLYLMGAENGKIYAYRNSSKEWEEFKKPEPTWEEKYEEWIKNPEPYGGMSVLEKIKTSKDQESYYVDLTANHISDLSPLAGLTSLVVLDLRENNVSDLSPLAGLANLEDLYLAENKISDLTHLAGLTKLYTLELSKNNISDLSPLVGLSNLTSLFLGNNDISDLSHLAGLENLGYLTLENNKISDLSPLERLSKLQEVTLENGNETASFPNFKIIYKTTD